MNYILFDGPSRNALLPFTFTRPVADIRIGILTIREKWEHFLQSTTTTLTEEYLLEKHPMVELEQNIMICASFCPSENLVVVIQNLKPQQAIFQNEEVIAFFTEDSQEEVDFDTYEIIDFDEHLITV
ncbi:putative sugar nucleotidyl transferase, partial [Flavobacterium sp.]|uniref:putative sugar nucleotidyl transferase n=1 Tax=Flavobacterium sp. TaxID=239 RepID=UPI00375169A7